MSLRAQKAAKKKEDMIRSALSMIEAKGYHNTTMADIASALLMTKGSLYYYFRDKQDLLYQSQEMLLSRSIEHIQAIMERDMSIREQLHEAITVHIQYLIAERTGFAMGMKPEQFYSGEALREILTLRNQYSEHMDQLLIKGMEKGEFLRMDIKIVRNIMLGAMNWVIQWYSPEGGMNQDELAQTIADYLLNMFTKTPNERGVIHDGNE